MLTKAVLLLCSLTLVSSTSDLSAVDQLRQELLAIDQLLQNDYQAGVQTYIHTIDKYYEFGRSVEEQFPVNRKMYFNGLNNFSLWKRAKSEIEIIENMYGRFQQMQKDLIEREGPFQLDQWIKFTDIVTSDPSNSVILRLIHITDIVALERLFYAAYEVPSKHQKEKKKLNCNKNSDCKILIYSNFDLFELMSQMKRGNFL